MENKKKCFIITPIGSDDDPIRRHIEEVIDEAIIPVLNDKYEVVVAHRVKLTGSITKQILEDIFKSELVIANLTSVNPNVMYELAYRHCLGKPVITIAEMGTKIPFDVIDNRTIFYVNDPVGMRELRKELEEFLTKINFDDTRQGPIYDTLHSIHSEGSVIKLLEETTDSDSATYFKEILDKVNYIIDREQDRLNKNNQICWYKSINDNNVDKYINLNEFIGKYSNTKVDEISNIKKYNFKK